jgi:hypothetical protein
MYTLGEAATATGMSKAALSKAIKQGRISAKRKEGRNDGAFEIDPAELHRVYPPVNTKPPISEHEQTQETVSENAQLKAKVDALGELLEQVKAERDDLRKDRDHWRQQATNLLTHQPANQNLAKRRVWPVLVALLALAGGMAGGVYLMSQYGFLSLR